MFAQYVADASAGKFHAARIGEQRHVLAAVANQAIFFHIRAKQFHGVRYEGHMPGFGSFAGQFDDRRMIQTDISDAQVTKLLYSRAGIVKYAQQRCIAPISARRETRRGEKWRKITTLAKSPKASYISRSSEYVRNNYRRKKVSTTQHEKGDLAMLSKWII